jgi:hypothetical protein
MDINSFALGYSAGVKKVPPSQEKEATITENGTTEITPDEGKLLSKVTINTDLAETGMPIEVATSEEMDAILSEADEEAVGSLYLYIGETTSAYKNGTIYSLQKEE